MDTTTGADPDPKTPDVFAEEEEHLGATLEKLVQAIDHASELFEHCLL